jgi:hypothetical protein
MFCSLHWFDKRWPADSGPDSFAEHKIEARTSVMRASCDSLAGVVEKMNELVGIKRDGSSGQIPVLTAILRRRMVRFAEFHPRSAVAAAIDGVGCRIEGESTYGAKPL